MRPGDRCYQGMTIAFDFSVEELWVPLIAGATLVPGKAGTNLVGSDLADYLFDRHVTVVACVPTLLATIERDLPELRILLVSGEACPQNLVVRWHRAGRSILNAYGPTEATVTATLTELYPDKPVTIGGPLPTYTIVILDAEKDEAVAPGALGEIGIAGIGLAQGYLNRPDLTQQKFIPDFLHIPNNPSKRIYRTGDLGRINDHDEVEFHGRIDTQVKISRLPDRADRNRIGPHAASADRAGGRRQVRVRAGRGRARGLLFAQAGSPASHADRTCRHPAQEPAGLHDPRLYRGASRHSDDVEPQGGPKKSSRAEGAALCRAEHELRRAAHADRRGARERPHGRDEDRACVDRGPLLPGFSARIRC